MTELLKELLTDEQVEMLKQNNVSEYYRLNFGDEDEYEDVMSNINTDVTFYDYIVEMNTLDGNIYTLIGVDDILVREHLFERLAKLLEWDYQDVYNIWTEY